MVHRYEVTHLLPKIPSAANAGVITRVFNAALTMNDDGGNVHAYLAESLPQLNSDSWIVTPDGRMDTTYRLRPGLTWHDGHPMDAEDFVFAWRVYTNPSLPVMALGPQRQMQEVVAVDPRTLLIRWRSPYPSAGNIQSGEFDPLPRHVLERSFASLEQNPGEADAFLGQPALKGEYIGAGPYRLVRWEPGSYFEGVAFDGHILGRPKIDQVVVKVMGDDSVILTNLLAGTMDWAQLRFEQGLVLQREWERAGKGTVYFPRASLPHYWVQHRPDIVGHPALQDIRVRRAIAHSLDRQAVSDGVYDGQGLITDTMVPRSEPFYPDVDRAVMHYQYDPRRSEQLMNEAGYSKDRDEFFANASGERYWLDFQTVAGSEFERTQLIMVDSWQRVGFELRPTVLPVAQITPGEPRHVFPGIATKGGALSERHFTSAEVGSPSNRWTGENRAGWSNAEYDQLWDTLSTTLEGSERTRLFVQMQRLISEQIPVMYTHFAITPEAHVSSLRGPTAPNTGTGTFTATTLNNWNIHQWEWK